MSKGQSTHAASTEHQQHLSDISHDTHHVTQLEGVTVFCMMLQNTYAFVKSQWGLQANLVHSCHS